MSQRERKRDRVKKAIKSGFAPIKSGGKKIAKFTKSRIVRKFIPLFGLIAIITPRKVLAFTLDDAAVQFGASATFIAAEYKGMREVTRTGVSAISDPSIRSAVATVGSLASLVGGVSCGMGSAVCSGMGWEQKAMVCLHGVGICAGVASGVHEADPVNPLTLPGGLAGDAVGKMSA